MGGLCHNEIKFYALNSWFLMNKINTFSRLSVDTCTCKHTCGWRVNQCFFSTITEQNYLWNNLILDNL